MSAFRVTAYATFLYMTVYEDNEHWFPGIFVVVINAFNLTARSPSPFPVHGQIL